MTIKIENDETTLCVQGIETTSPSTLCFSQGKTSTKVCTPLFGGDRDIATCSTRAGARVFVSSLLKDASLYVSPYNIGDELFDVPDLCQSEDDNYVDDDSSISSYESTIADDHEGRRVHFLETIVSEIRTRPRTRPEDLRRLFYTYEETQRFRHEYRLERKLHSQGEPEVYHGEEKDSLENNIPLTNKPQCVDSSKRSRRHYISHVVVEHNHTLETFYNEESSSDIKKLSLLDFQNNEAADDFFDNDSFWSGSITWY